MASTDTIAAVATALGQGAVALLRVSGPEARAFVARVFRGRDLASALARQAILGRVVDESGQTIDQVLVTCFDGPASYTGENVVEIGCHGGVLVTRKILERLLAVGCRAAEPGEFTQRAFLSGKLDLTQAEAVMDLISAQTDLALRAANEQLRGRLGEAAMAIREELIGVTAHVEAYIDFPDEDIDPDTGASLIERLGRARARIDSLLASADQGRVLREGARVAIGGPPNVGKSSLLNRLLGFERAIVTAIPGTTRDTVEEVVNLEGVPVRLIDTAGIREAGDLVEQEGVRRSEAAIAAADLALEVIDGHEPPAPFAFGATPRKTLRVLNKADLGLHPDHDLAGAVVVSCREGAGFGELARAIRDAVLGDTTVAASDFVAINARHQDCLRGAREALDRAIAALRDGLSPEFAAVDLREAMEWVGEMVGKVDVEEILGQIFASFCIGK